MQTLKDLLVSPEGRDFLQTNGVFFATRAFLDRLSTPTRTDLIHLVGAPGGVALVCTAQQVYTDYRQSVLDKIAVLHTLSAAEGVFAFQLWADTDRVGSDKVSTTINWPLAEGQQGLRFVPRHGPELYAETRFVELDSRKVQETIDRIRLYLFSAVTDKRKRSRASEKYEALKTHSLETEAATLRDLNHRLSSFLLEHHFVERLPSLFTSRLVNEGLMTAPINEALNHIMDFVSVWNREVDGLKQAAIDPQVGYLPEDYLPLYYSCERDNFRLRLHHQIAGEDHFAAATCRCGADYRFHLGNTSLSIIELEATQRWSPDVALPVFFNDLISGVVAGKSSALYGLVLNGVLRQVLGQQPVPLLVPMSLDGKEGNGRTKIDSLVYHFLTS